LVSLTASVYALTETGVKPYLGPWWLP
jgi:hypothetical protein